MKRGIKKFCFYGLSLMLGLGSGLQAQSILDSPDAGVFLSPEHLHDLASSAIWAYLQDDQVANGNLRWALVKAIQESLSQAEFQMQPDETGSLQPQPYSVQRRERVAIGGLVLDQLVMIDNEQEIYSSLRQKLLGDYEGFLRKVGGEQSSVWLQKRLSNFRKVLRAFEAWDLVVDYRLDVKPNFTNLNLEFGSAHDAMTTTRLPVVDAKAQLKLDPEIFVHSVVGFVQNRQTGELVDLDLFPNYNQLWELPGVEIEIEAGAALEIKNGRLRIAYDLAPLPLAASDPLDYFGSRPIKSNLLPKKDSPIRLSPEDVDYFLDQIFFDIQPRLTKVLTQLLPLPNAFFGDLFEGEEVQNPEGSFAYIIDEVERAIVELSQFKQVELHLWVESDENLQLEIKLGVSPAKNQWPAQLNQSLQEKPSSVIAHFQSSLTVSLEDLQIELQPEEQILEVCFELPAHQPVRWQIKSLQFPRDWGTRLNDLKLLEVLESLQSLNLVASQEAYVNFELELFTSGRCDLNWGFSYRFEQTEEDQYPKPKIDVESLYFEAPLFEQIKVHDLRLRLNSQLDPIVLQPESEISWAEQFYAQLPLIFEHLISSFPQPSLSRLDEWAAFKLSEGVGELRAQVKSRDFEFEYALQDLIFKKEDVQLDWFSSRVGSSMTMVQRKDLPEFYASILDSPPLHSFQVLLQPPGEFGVELKNLVIEQASVGRLAFRLKTEVSRSIVIQLQMFRDSQGRLFILPVAHNLEAVFQDYEFFEGSLSISELNPKIFGLNLSGGGAAYRRPIENLLVERIVREQIKKQKPVVVRALESFLVDLVNGGLVLSEAEIDSKIAEEQWMEVSRDNFRRVLESRSDLSRFEYFKRQGFWEKHEGRQSSLVSRIEALIEGEVHRLESEFYQLEEKLIENLHQMRSLSVGFLAELKLNGRIEGAYQRFIEIVGKNLSEIPQQVAEPIEGNPNFEDYQAFVQAPELFEQYLQAERFDIFSIVQKTVVPLLEKASSSPLDYSLRPEQFERPEDFPEVQKAKGFDFQICLVGENLLERFGLFTYFHDRVDPKRALFCDLSSLGAENQMLLEQLIKTADGEEAYVAFLNPDFAHRELLRLLPAIEFEANQALANSSRLVDQNFKLLIDRPELHLREVQTAQGQWQTFPVLDLDLTIHFDAKDSELKQIEQAVDQAIESGFIDRLLERGRHLVLQEAFDQEWLAPYLLELIESIDTAQKREAMGYEEAGKRVLFLIRRIERQEDQESFWEGFLHVLSLTQYRPLTKIELRVPFDIQVESFAERPEQGFEKGYAFKIKTSDTFQTIGNRLRLEDYVLADSAALSIGSQLVVGAVRDQLREFEFEYFLPMSLGLPLIEDQLQFKIGDIIYHASEQVGGRGLIQIPVLPEKGWMLGKEAPFRLDYLVEVNDQVSALEYLNHFLLRRHETGVLNYQWLGDLSGWAIQQFARDVDFDFTSFEIEVEFFDLGESFVSLQEAGLQFQSQGEIIFRNKESGHHYREIFEVQMPLDYMLTRYQYRESTPLRYYPWVLVKEIRLLSSPEHSHREEPLVVKKFKKWLLENSSFTFYLEARESRPE